MRQFKYLILSGGAQHGMMFLGALAFLESMLLFRYRKTIKQHFAGFAGTSVGALILFCVLCDVNEDEISCIFTTPLKNLNEIISQILIQTLIKIFGHDQVTFQEFQTRTKKIFKICACNLNNLSLQIFCIENTPQVKILDAIKASMALPFLFDPIVIGNNTYVDGGCQFNLPFGIFPFKQTLSLWIQVKHETKTNLELKDPTIFTKRIIETFFYGQDSVIESLLIPNQNIICFQCDRPGIFFQQNVNVSLLKKLGAKILSDYFKKESMFLWHLYDLVGVISLILIITTFLDS